MNTEERKAYLADFGMGDEAGDGDGSGLVHEADLGDRTGEGHGRHRGDESGRPAVGGVGQMACRRSAVRWRKVIDTWLRTIGERGSEARSSDWDLATRRACDDHALSAHPRPR